MKRIQVSKHRTPTADNQDCPYSVGLLNLTEPEVGLIREFVSTLERARPTYPRPGAAASIRERMDRAVANGAAREAVAAFRTTYPEIPAGWTAAGVRAAMALGLTTAETTPDEIERILADTTWGNSGVTEPAPAPAPRNRFSGLDIE